MNSPPSFFFPMQWAAEAPQLWEWIKSNALHTKHALNRDGWYVWMPVIEG